MSTQIAELRRVRGNAKGQLTRTAGSLTAMKGKSLAEYDLAVIERYEKQIEKCNQSFAESHAALALADTSATQDQFCDEEEEHERAIDAFKRMSIGMKSCLHARALGRRLRIVYQDMHVGPTLRYTEGVELQYQKMHKDMSTFQEIISRDDVSTHPEIAELRSELTQQWYNLDQARTDSGLLTPVPETGASLSASIPRRQSAGVTVKPPPFSGCLTEFQDFKKLFLDVMSKQSQLADSEKCAVLMESMKSEEAQDRARSAIKSSSSFADAMARLSRRYENPRDVVAFHLSEILQMRIMSQTQEDVQALLRLIDDNAVGLTLARCTTASQLITAYMDGKLDPALRLARRTKSAGLDIPPSLEQFRSFLEEQEQIVSSNVVSLVKEEESSSLPTYTHQRRQSPRCSFSKRSYSLHAHACHNQDC